MSHKNLLVNQEKTRAAEVRDFQYSVPAIPASLRNFLKAKLYQNGQRLADCFLSEKRHLHAKGVQKQIVADSNLNPRT